MHGSMVAKLHKDDTTGILECAKTHGEYSTWRGSPSRVLFFRTHSNTQRSKVFNQFPESLIAIIADDDRDSMSSLACW